MRLHPETRPRPLDMRFDTHALTGHTGSPVLARPTGVGYFPGWRGSARSGNGFNGCPCEIVGRSCGAGRDEATRESEAHLPFDPKVEAAEHRRYVTLQPCTRHVEILL